MFNQIFKNPCTISRYLNAPLLEDRLNYLNYRSKQSSTRTVLREIACYQLIIIKHLRLDNEGVITFKEIKSAANRWAQKGALQRQFKDFSFLEYKRFIRHATLWLRFLGRIETPIPRSVPEKIIEFSDYMREERGLSEITILKNCRQVQEFFNQIKKDPNQFLAHLTPRHLDKWILQRLHQRNYVNNSIKLFAYRLRAFFRYAESRGWCQPGISNSIQAPRVYTHQTLPSSPSWEDVQRLLKTTEGNSLSNIRARAILLLLAVYGFRDSEVRRLKFDDFDWERQIFLVKRSKCGPTQQFPLVKTVGEALIRYIKEARPHQSSHREIFLTIYAPFRPLKSLNDIVSHHWESLNIAIKYHGTHSLRHACATRLINQGMTIKTIADQLGHRDLETTRVYAKVDLLKLRKVANFKLGGLL